MAAISCSTDSISFFYIFWFQAMTLSLWKKVLLSDKIDSLRVVNVKFHACQCISKYSRNPFDLKEFLFKDAINTNIFYPF